jgi:2-polyprenyl-3-methyl-5-hydroxy-6-metoxy-1,4-benzoquinol methylase
MSNPVKEWSLKTAEKADHLTPQAKILNVPCGAGRLCLELASRGYHMTGVDLALPLLDDARRKATQRQLEIAWEDPDMRDLPWKEEFDYAPTASFASCLKGLAWWTVRGMAH